jgi:HIRAN domain
MARTNAQRAHDEERLELALSGKLLPKHDRRIHTKVVGVTAYNEDGSSRQAAIGQLAQFDLVELVHNKADRFDSNAIQVFVTVPDRLAGLSRMSRSNGIEMCRVQIGHLDRELAAELAPLMDAGDTWAGIASRVGGYHGMCGVSVMLYRAVTRSGRRDARGRFCRPDQANS